MARVTMTREMIEKLDDKLLEANHTTREELLKDLADYKIMLDHTYGGTLRWYKRPFLERLSNTMGLDFKLTKEDAAKTIVSTTLAAAVVIGGYFALVPKMEMTPPTAGLEQFIAMGDYDTCNAYVTDAMIRFQDLIATTEGTQRNYYIGMQEEMESLRNEVERTYHDYEEAQALGIDTTQSLTAYKDAFHAFEEKAASIGIRYVAPENTVDTEGPKLG